MFYTKEWNVDETRKSDSAVYDSMTKNVCELYDKCLLMAQEQGVSLSTMGILLKTTGDLMLMGEKYEKR